MQMLKDISFGKAICGMAICLLLAGYVECHASNYKLSDKPVKKSKKVDVATIPESNVIIVEDK